MSKSPVVSFRNTALVFWGDNPIRTVYLGTFPLWGAVPALTISGFMFPTVEVNSDYNESVLADGGLTPYLYSLEGSWPAGITIESSTGIISGSANTPGVYDNLSVRVRDARGYKAYLDEFTLTVTD